MEFDVIRSNRKTFAIEIRNNKVLVRAPLQVTDEQINACVSDNKDWIEKHLAKELAKQQALDGVEKLTIDELRKLADKALKFIPERVAYFAPLVGVAPSKIVIRNQRTKWGSCSGKGNLNFNCLLMLTPPEVIDSVVVHELCHLKEMNHSDKFYSEVLRVFPDYWRCDKWLKDEGAMLFKKMP